MNRPAPPRGGEVCVGRIRGADPAAAPDTYRLVFTLFEADPEDENDFGSGVSKIFDPAELMLLLSRMEREGVFADGAGSGWGVPISVRLPSDLRQGQGPVSELREFYEGDC